MMKRLPFGPHHRRVRWLAGPALFVACAALLAYAPFHLPESVRVFVQDSATPLLSARVTLTSAVIALYETVESKESLVRENARLYEELSALRQANFMTDILASENKRLRELIYQQAEHTPGHTATVLAGPIGNLYESLLIDKGARDGVQEHALVLVGEHIALGYVEQVAEKSARVALFSAPEQMFEVLVGRASTTRVLAQGLGGGGFSVQLPRNVPIEVGDPVLLPTEYPYLLAHVESLTGELSDPFVTAWFKSPVSFHEVRTVTVRSETWIPTVMESLP